MMAPGCKPGIEYDAITASFEVKDIGVFVERDGHDPRNADVRQSGFHFGTSGVRGDVEISLPAIRGVV